MPPNTHRSHLPPFRGTISTTIEWQVHKVKVDPLNMSLEAENLGGILGGFCFGERR